VLFDFSGTLFRIESTESWLRAVLDESGLTLGAREWPATAGALREAGAQPGGAPPVRIPDELAGPWGIRDCSAELHRAAYTALSRQVPLHDARWHMAPACAALGAAPGQVVMVGDDRHADGGATALGCRVHFVDHLPAAERPDALRAVLGLVDRQSGRCLSTCGRGSRAVSDDPPRRPRRTAWRPDPAPGPVRLR
jgi:hypothetical protein